MLLNQTIVSDVARLHLDFILCDDSLQWSLCPKYRSPLVREEKRNKDRGNVM